LSRQRGYYNMVGWFFCCIHIIKSITVGLQKVFLKLLFLCASQWWAR
jgi:hypothetical protein